MTHRCIHAQENKHHVNTLAPLYVLSGRGKRRKKAVENSQFFKTCQTARSHNSKACDFLNTTLTSQQNCKPTCRDPEEQEEHTVFPFPPDNYLSIFTTLFFEQAGQKVIAWHRPTALEQSLNFPRISLLPYIGKIKRREGGKKRRNLLASLKFPL